MATSRERESPAIAADQLPAPGENYNPGPPTRPRQAASVILLRDGAASSPEGPALELLLVKRTPKARFMGGVWVFPGGAVDSEDGEDARAHLLAAVRELHEEAGVTLEDPALLVRFSRWITPEQVQIRFDTHFFLAELPAGQEPRIDGQECVDLGWFTPADALEAHRAGELQLVFPTIKRTAARVPVGREADGVRARTRGAAGAAAGGAGGRGRAHPAAGRAGVLSAALGRRSAISRPAAPRSRG
jgi:8-oxo-dGTP pyrophosphatase MutT (NUDIX family)